MADTADSIRAFVAINFPQRVKTLVINTIQQLTKGKGKVSWVKPEGVHLTLKFLGNISPHQLEQVKQALEISVSDIEPFSINLTQLGVFPNERRPQVIWWGLTTSSQQLFQLYDNMEKQLHKRGFPREKRRFVPHLTLGRVRELTQPQQLINQLSKVGIPICPPITIDQLALMQSTLTRTGAIYNRIATFPFQG